MRHEDIEQIEAGLYEQEIARFPDFADAIRKALDELKEWREGKRSADQMAAVMLQCGTSEQQAEILASIAKARPAAISIFKPGVADGIELAVAWHESAAASETWIERRDFHKWSAQELRKLENP